jgi:hypothetical protein
MDILAILNLGEFFPASGGKIHFPRRNCSPIKPGEDFLERQF